MNRLWVRFSLAFVGVVLAVIVIVGTTIRLTSVNDDRQNLEGLGLSAAEIEAIELLENSATLEKASLKASREIFPIAVTMVTIITGTAAIIAGVWMSRRLTKPLDSLQTAARAIGDNNLSFRVDISGTEEMVEVGTAFNQMADQLEQSENLRRNLLADVAHELRHPVHVLQGNLQAILDDVYPLEKAEIARLADQTRHLSVLVNDLHLLAQAESQQLPLHRHKLDLGALVKETAVAFRSTAAANEIKLQVELLGSMPVVYVDADRMRQIVNNLLINALRHTQADDQIMVSVEQVDNILQIRIKDSGSGISKSDLPHLFDRFYRTDSARSRDQRGAGLGLAIVRALVEAHGGGVTAVSDGLGQGSTFTLWLPL
ncbi:MAG: HAMP domain-containing protein [Chloroflexi bacterium]|nr:HAMP domain-containing protein [Chloroflexota bacterium]